MKTLMIDARWLNTGLGAYTISLVRGLKDDGRIKPVLLTQRCHVSKLTPFQFDLIVDDSPIYSVSEQVRLPWKSRCYDVLHVPHYNAPLLRNGPTLCTIHDLTHILDATQRKTAKSWMYAQPMLRLVSRRADYFFTVSEYSKAQLIEHLGIAPERITVTYNCVPQHIYPEPRDESRQRINEEMDFQGPYILFVGNLKPSKNVAGLLEAFAAFVKRRGLTHKLLIIGNAAVGRTRLMHATVRLGLQKAVVFSGAASDTQMRFAYSGADVTVLPSFQEGFGLPILESMTCGTPVICSSSASLPEVAGQAAEYCYAKEPESIATALETVLSSPARWRDLQMRGVSQAARFTRRDFLGRHLSVYKQFLSCA